MYDDTYSSSAVVFDRKGGEQELQRKILTNVGPRDSLSERTMTMVSVSTLKLDDMIPTVADFQCRRLCGGNLFLVELLS